VGAACMLPAVCFADDGICSALSKFRRIGRGAVGGGFEGARAATDCARCCASAATSSSLLSPCAFRLCGLMLLVRRRRLLTLRSTGWEL
jgi:hypothetical protein